MTQYPDPTVPIDLTTLRILVVDDEPMLRSVIQDFLTMLGVEHQFVAGDGLEALELIRAEKLDCVLSDIRMPKMELEELLGILQIEFPNLIVLATSGYSDLESARNIFSKGAHDFLGKPLNLDALELALNWIVERDAILGTARVLFGRDALPVAPEQAAARLDQLVAIMRREACPFAAKRAHAIRLMRLIQQLQLDLAPAEQTDLLTAALLHEMGMGYQIQSICRQPRRLDEDELRLVQEHSQVTGRMIANVLDRPEFNTLIGRHLAWPMMSSLAREQWPVLDYRAAWLGVLNCIDGCLHDRPDRSALSSAQMREMLVRRHQKHPLPQIAQALDQWPVIESFYVSAAGR